MMSDKEDRLADKLGIPDQYEQHEWAKPDGNNLRRFYFDNEKGSPVLLDLPVVEELLRQAGWYKIT